MRGQEVNSNNIYRSLNFVNMLFFGKILILRGKERGEKVCTGNGYIMFLMTLSQFSCICIFLFLSLWPSGKNIFHHSWIISIFKSYLVWFIIISGCVLLLKKLNYIDLQWAHYYIINLSIIVIIMYMCKYQIHNLMVISFWFIYCI